MISLLDISICVLYVLAILLIGLWYGMKQRTVLRSQSADAYFLAGKSLKWPSIGLALFATNISTVHLVSLAQSGFDSGLLNGNFEWMASFTLILLAIFFAPFYIKSGIATLPDFLERRYDKACRDWLAFVSIISAVIIHIAFSMLAGGFVLQTLLGIDMYMAIVIISVITAVYTIVGGLKAVVVTESIQTVVLILGAVIITVASYVKMGGWNEMVAQLSSEGKMDKLSMMRPHGDSSGMPWYAVFLGYPVIGIWYWCADQTIVQRVLGAKDVNHARAGALFCGFIKILPVFLFVLPGLFAYTLANKGLLNIEAIRFVDPSGGVQYNTKGIYTLMITQLLPKGLVGILVAALLSGLMSQVSGAINSISTMVSYDIYKRYRPQADESKIVKVGKVSAAVAVLVSLGLLPLLNRYESIFTGINDVIAHIAPPITCVFLLGLFWKRASAVSARFTLWIGSAAGIIVFAVNKLSYSSILGDIPFMVMAFYLFCFCFLLQVLLTTFYPAKHTAESAQLYWKSWREPLLAKGWKGLANYKFQSVLLLLIMVVLFWIFR